MANRGIKVLGCMTLMMGAIGGVLSGKENKLDDHLSFTHWEEQLVGKETLSFYTDQKDRVETYIKSKLRDSHIEGIKNLQGELLYLICGTEEKKLQDGECTKVRSYYTLVYPNEAHAELGMHSEEKLELKKLKHIYIPQTSSVPYVDEMSKKEREVIGSLLEVVFSKDEKFWKTYEARWLEGFSSWESFLSEAPLLGTKLQVAKETYQEDYSQVLNITLEEEKFIPNEEKMTYEVMPYTTKNQHFFNIKIPVRVLREGDNGLYYNYHYLVGINKDNIVSLKFLRREPIMENVS